MMWSEQIAGPAPGYMPYNMRLSKSAPCSPIKPTSNEPGARVDPFHIVHNVPAGDSPYVKAKHVQLVDRDPERAVALFWAAINSGDRVDSALKDMAIVMKQQSRPQDAIEAIISLRSRCSEQAQESLDNVLLDLYKRCGRLDDQIDLLKHKLHLIHQGMAFNGKRTKTARSQGKKFQVSVGQEATRLLGNLGWTYMQQANFVAAEAVYRKALSIESDNNKVCNLGICLMKQGRLEEAKSMLQSVTPACNDSRWASDSHMKSYERAQEMLEEVKTSMGVKGYHERTVKQFSSFPIPGCDTDANIQESSLWQPQPAVPRQPRRSSRSTVVQQLSQLNVDPSMIGALLATSGFGPAQPDTSIQGVVCASLDMAGIVSRHPGPLHGERSFLSQSCLQGGGPRGWEDDDVDYTSPDESSDGSRDGSDAQRCQQDLTKFTLTGTDDEETQWYAETLRRQMANLCALENSLLDSQVSIGMEGEAVPTTASSTEFDLVLSSEAQPFNPVVGTESLSVHSTSSDSHADAILPASDAIDDCLSLTSDHTNELHNGHDQVGVQEEPRRVVKPLLSTGMWAAPLKNTHSVFDNGWNQGDQIQPTSRQSLSPEFSGTQVMESSDMDQPSLQYPHVNSVGLPPLHAAPGKQNRKTTPIKEKTVSTWGLMGVTYNPGDLNFGRANGEFEISGQVRDASWNSEVAEHERLNSMEKLSASEMEMRRQRRLRVFQEMTLSKTLLV